MLLAQISPGIWWGRALNALVAVAALFLCFRLRREPADSPTFGFLFATVLAATILAIPMVAPYNQILLLPGVIFLARNWNTLWRRSLLTKTACVVGLFTVFWPWIATVGLAVAALFWPLQTLQSKWAMPLFTSLGIPVVVLGLLALQSSVVGRQSPAGFS
jgi:hypothetical protein